MEFETEEKIIQSEEQAAESQEPAEEAEDNRDAITQAKENFYDRLPFTYRQVDIFCKAAIGILIAIFVYYGMQKAL
ncbi:MAG: hypothetical protein MR416_06925 [Lachnospiraceae bacterium]|nr:hypothetical protein [Lachnospiraceae bacterium]